MRVEERERADVAEPDRAERGGELEQELRPRPQRAAVVALAPTFDVHCFDALEDYTLATASAHVRVRTASDAIEALRAVCHAITSGNMRSPTRCPGLNVKRR